MAQGGKVICPKQQFLSHSTSPALVSSLQTGAALASLWRFAARVKVGCSSAVRTSLGRSALRSALLHFRLALGVAQLSSSRDGVSSAKTL